MAAVQLSFQAMKSVCAAVGWRRGFLGRPRSAVHRKRLLHRNGSFLPRRSLSTLPSASPPDAVSSRDKGLAFEQQVVRLMQTLNCRLHATQQSRDGGIDHQGAWTLPDLEVEVVTQCKNESKPVGVHYVREFHGVLSFFSPNAVGLFASASGYSLYAQRFFLRMEHPAILCTVDVPSARITSFLLNDRAQTLLPKLTVGSLFVDQEHALVLTYGDQILG